MSDRAAKLYVRAFGEERYKHYRSAVNKSAVNKLIKEQMELRHAGFHDVESFIWVLFHELLLAWQKNSADGGDEFSYEAHIALNGLENHTFGKNDGRLYLLSNDADDWMEILPPELGFLAESLVQIAAYIRVEWAYWPELPEDHAHEALAIMLLEMACMIEERGDIELREEEKCLWRRAEDKAATVYMFPSLHDTNPYRKRAGEDLPPGVPKKLKTTHVAQDNAAAAQIERPKPAKANKRARQVRPTPAKPLRKQGKKVPPVKNVQKDGT